MLKTGLLLMSQFSAHRFGATCIFLCTALGAYESCDTTRLVYTCPGPGHSKKGLFLAVCLFLCTCCLFCTFGWSITKCMKVSGSQKRELHLDILFTTALSEVF